MFEPDPHWYDRLPPDPALARLEGEDLELWPDISYGERLGLGWSLLVSDRQDEIRDRARDVPGFRWSAVGLLDPEVDRALGDDAPTFGVILYAVDDLVEGEEGRREDLAFEDIRLPVVVRRGEYEDHHGIGHGRVACWATSRGGARAGWLTARHVADHPAMASVGSVVDRASQCLDAALVDLGVPGGGTRRPLATPVQSGTVEMDLGSPRSATVIDVDTTLGIRRSSWFPLRFSLNAAGVAGDSGSMIIGTPCGEPMGIYLGAFTSTAGARSGVGLALTQIQSLMNLEVYR